jgi:hypothetical protein
MPISPKCSSPDIVPLVVGLPVSPLTNEFEPLTYQDETPVSGNRLRFCFMVDDSTKKEEML